MASSDEGDSLDHFISGASTGQVIVADVNPHLSYPSFLALEEPITRTESSSASRTLQLCKDRIYVGNLHGSVDEYTLIQVFSKFGKITNVDFLFHKSGPLKGKPRGYGFIKYANETDAQKAIATAHDKLLRGRKITVTYAHHAPIDAGGSGGRGRRTMMEVGRPTTLSLLKSGPTSKPIGTAAKIARVEAKLRQLERDSNTPSNTVPLHPSLPPKPPPTEAQPNSGARRISKPRVPEDAPPPSLLKLTSSSLTLPPAGSSNATQKPNKPKSKLLGVKIKPKEKADR